MELSSYIIWNAIITLVLGPILYSIRQNSSEAKRLDILFSVSFFTLRFNKDKSNISE